MIFNTFVFADKKAKLVHANAATGVADAGKIAYDELGDGIVLLCCYPSNYRYKTGVKKVLVSTKRPIGPQRKCKRGKLL